MTFGVIRAYVFGWKRREINLEEAEPTRSPQQRRHLVMGIVWVFLGIVMAVSGVQAASLGRQQRARAAEDEVTSSPTYKIVSPSSIRGEPAK